MKNQLEQLIGLFSQFVLEKDEYKQAFLVPEIKNAIKEIKDTPQPNPKWGNLLYWIDDAYNQLCQSEVYNEPELFLTNDGRIHEDKEGFDNPKNVEKIGGDVIRWAVLSHFYMQVDDYLGTRLE